MRGDRVAKRMRRRFLVMQQTLQAGAHDQRILVFHRLLEESVWSWPKHPNGARPDLRDGVAHKLLKNIVVRTIVVGRDFCEGLERSHPFRRPSFLVDRGLFESRWR